MTCQHERQSTGIPGLDELMGGGLIPGTLTVVFGATGIGKTQLGLQFAHAGRRQEQRSGVIFDVAARGDSQNHANYARSMFDWELSIADSQKQPKLEQFFSCDDGPGDYLHLFDYRGRRVTRRDLSHQQWQQWQGELNAKLQTAIAFLYGNFVRGSKRIVVDGVEPAERPHDSIQFSLFEYVYHQIVRKESQWVARDLFRQQYRSNADAAAEHGYDESRIGCLLLCTSHGVMLEEMISRGVDEGDVVCNANTLIYMGKMRQGTRVQRGLHVAKHRGSPCSDDIVPFTIDQHGIRIE